MMNQENQQVVAKIIQRMQDYIFALENEVYGETTYGQQIAELLSKKTSERVFPTDTGADALDLTYEEAITLRDEINKILLNGIVEVKSGFGSPIGNVDVLHSSIGVGVGDIIAFDLPVYDGSLLLRKAVISGEEYVQVFGLPYNKGGFQDLSMFSPDPVKNYGDADYLNMIGIKNYTPQSVAQVLINYLRQTNGIIPVFPKAKVGDKVMVVDKDVSSEKEYNAKKKIGTIKNITYFGNTIAQTSIQEPHTNVKIEFSDGDPNSPTGKFYTKSYNFPDGLHYIFNQEQAQEISTMGVSNFLQLEQTITEPVLPRQKSGQTVSSPYTEIVEPYVMENKPPPVSALAGAFYGSNAYENPVTPSHDIIFSGLVKTTFMECPQVTGGSAPKYVVANPHNATCILVKKYQTPLQPVVETFCAHIHRALGMPAPDMRFQSNTNELYSPLVSGAFQPLTSTKLKAIFKGQFNHTNADINKNAYHNIVELFIVSTWLTNWDVLGLSFDNTLIDSMGNVQCIDLGGALMLKATGGFKTQWNPLWDGSYQDIKMEMNKAFGQMQTIGNNKFFKGFVDLNNPTHIGNEYAKIITAKMMMLFHPKYNYAEKLTTWTNLPEASTKSGYSAYTGIGNLTNASFCKWLEARALALYEIVRGI